MKEIHRNNSVCKSAFKISKETDNPVLSLSNLQLFNLPADLCNLVHITNLQVDNNKLTDIPLSLSKLVNLTSINLSHNLLRQVPVSLCLLKKITSIDLRANSITKIPPQLCALEKLSVLLLEENPISRIPCSLHKLQNLKTFTFDVNDGLKFPKASILKHHLTVKDTLNYLRQKELEINTADFTAVLIFGESQAGYVTFIVFGLISYSKSTLLRSIREKGKRAKSYEFGEETFRGDWQYRLGERKHSFSFFELESGGFHLCTMQCATFVSSVL